jgi:hypothetical protein
VQCSYSDVDHLSEEKVSRFRFPLVSMAIGGPLTIDLSLVASSHGTEGERCGVAEVVT